MKNNQHIEKEIKLLQEILKLRNIVSDNMPVREIHIAYGLKVNNDFEEWTKHLETRLGELHKELDKHNQNIQEVVFGGEVDKDDFESSMTYICEMHQVDEKLHEMINTKLSEYSSELYEIINEYNEEKAIRIAKQEDIDEMADEFVNRFWNDLECEDEEVKQQILKRLGK